MTNGTFAVLDNERFLPTVDGRVKRDFSIWDFEGGGKFFTIFPYFHLAGFLSLVVNPVFTEASSPVIGPALAPPTGALMKEVLKYQKVKALYIPPSIAEQLLAEPDGLDYFKQLDFICYTGGPFSPNAGQKLVQVTDLVPLYGSTEAFQTPQLVPSKEDWAYMEWNPYFKHQMQPTEDGSYELVLFTDASTEKRSALNHNFPGTAEWRTRDLFKPHPSKPDLWQYYGRQDDIIVFSNGEKFNPVPTELMIGGNKLLSGVLVIGQGRTQASLFLEPKPGHEQDSETLVEDVWPSVDRANALAPAQGQITRSKIHVVPPATFVRAGKGTVIRKLSEQKLQEEVDELYSDQKPRIFLQSRFETSAIETFVRDIVADAFSRSIGLDDDLFEFGLDSLKSAEVIRNLKAGIKPLSDVKQLLWLSLDLVYRYPSISQLSEVLSLFLSSGTVPSTVSKVPSEEITSMIAEYTSNLPEPPFTPRKEQKAGLIIALTGSNGALGTALLQRLAADTRISRIYCLNRRHDEEHEAKHTSRVRFFKVQLHEDQLGLEDAEYKTVVSDVDIIIHNAWQLDFSLPLKAFRNQLHGVRRLIDWSLQSPQRPRIVFCSSVSSAMNWPLANPTIPVVPEAIISDYRGALETGYSTSKFVAENTLAAASQRSGVEVIILRLGQIVLSGDFSPNAKRVNSWISGLFETSKTLGCFPIDICDIDWLSLDEASATLYDLSTKPLPTSTGSTGPLLVYNAVNPSPCSWAEILPQLHDAGVTSGTPVPLTDWLARLQSASSNETANPNTPLPSSKILPFFRALGKGRQGLRYDTRKAQEACIILQSMRPVDRERVAGWIKLQG